MDRSQILSFLVPSQNIAVNPISTWFIPTGVAHCGRNEIVIVLTDILQPQLHIFCFTVFINEVVKTQYYDILYKKGNSCTMQCSPATHITFVEIAMFSF